MIRTASIGLTGLVLATCLGLSSPLPAFAQAQLAPGQAPPQFRPVDADRIVAAMQVDRLAEVLAAEIAVSGDPFRPDSPEQDGPDEGWGAIVSRVAPAGRIRAGLRDAIARGVEGLGDPAERAAVAEALSFWEGGLGRRVVLLEIGAREALAAPDIEATARESFAAAAARGNPRAAQVRALMDAADLVEPAVAASLNIAVATLEGAQEAAQNGPRDPSIIEDAWAQEPEIRADQTGWIEALVFMASAPLSDAEMVRLIEAAGHPGNRRLSAILNEAATTTFVDVARDLGRASALRLQGEQL